MPKQSKGRQREEGPWDGRPDAAGGRLWMAPADPEASARREAAWALAPARSTSGVPLRPRGVSAAGPKGLQALCLVVLLSE